MLRRAFTLLVQCFTVSFLILVRFAAKRALPSWSVLSREVLRRELFPIGSLIQRELSLPVVFRSELYPSRSSASKRGSLHWSNASKRALPLLVKYSEESSTTPGQVLRRELTSLVQCFKESSTHYWSNASKRALPPTGPTLRRELYLLLLQRFEESSTSYWSNASKRAIPPLDPTLRRELYLLLV